MVWSEQVGPRRSTVPSLPLKQAFPDRKCTFYLWSLTKVISGLFVSLSVSFTPVQCLWFGLWDYWRSYLKLYLIMHHAIVVIHFFLLNRHLTWHINKNKTVIYFSIFYIFVGPSKQTCSQPKSPITQIKNYITPQANVIKTSYGCNLRLAQVCWSICPWLAFWLSPMFVCKAVTFQMLHSRVCSKPYLQILHPGPMV